MTCNTCVYDVPEKPKYPPLAEIMRMAHEAVKSTYFREAYKYNWGAYAKFFDNDCKVLFENSRFRPVVIARYLCFRTLYDAGCTLSDIGRIFKMHHSSIIYGLEAIHNRKFMPDVERAYDVYNANFLMV